jgi:hypothetical protein
MRLREGERKPVKRRAESSFVTSRGVFLTALCRFDAAQLNCSNGTTSTANLRSRRCCETPSIALAARLKA